MDGSLDKAEMVKMARKKLSKFQLKRSSPIPPIASTTTSSLTPTIQTPQFEAPSHTSNHSISPTNTLNNPRFTASQTTESFTSPTSHTNIVRQTGTMTNSYERGPDGDRVFVVKHVERKKKTVHRTGTSTPSMADIEERKAQVNQLTAQLASITTALLAKSPTPQIKNLPTSPVHSPTRNNQQLTLIPPSNNSQQQQPSQLIPTIPTTEHIQLASLQNKLDNQTQELTLLRSVIRACAEKEFDPSVVQNGTLEAVKAWGVGLARRVREMEAGGGSNIGQGLPIRRGSTDARTIETQTWEVGVENESKEGRNVRELEQTLTLLSEQNARLRVDLEKSRDGEGVRMLQDQVVALKVAAKEMEATIKTLNVENLELRRTRSPGVESDDGSLYMLNGTGSSRTTELTRRLQDAVRKVDELESVNARLAKDNSLLREDYEGVSRQLEESVRDQTEAKQAIHEGAASIKKLKEEMTRKDHDLAALKAQWDKERLRWIEERKQSIEASAANAVSAGAVEAVEHLQIEVNKYKRESERRNLEFQEREAEFKAKIGVLEETIQAMERERLSNLNAISTLDIHSVSAEARVVELEKALELKDMDLATLKSDSRVRIAELENALRDARESSSTSKEDQTKIHALETALEMLETETTALLQERDELLEQLESTSPSAAAADPLILQTLRSENEHLSEAVQSLSQDLEAAYTRHAELNRKLKESNNSSDSIPLAEYNAVIAKHEYDVDRLCHQLETMKDRYHASQAKSQSLLDALNRTEGDLARLRLSQADIGNTILQKGDATESKDLITSLQNRNHELAKELLETKEELSEVQADFEGLKMRVHEGLVAVKEAGEVKRELEDLKNKFLREKEVWGLKERALYSATEKLQADYAGLVKMIGLVQRIIWDSAEGKAGWNRGVGAERVEDVDVAGWVRWMVDAHGKLAKDLEQTHELLDVQHEKIESVMSSAGVSRRSGSPTGGEGRRTRGLPSEKALQMSSLGTSSSSMNALINSWSNSVGVAGYSSHDNVSSQGSIVEGGEGVPDIVLPLPLGPDKKGSMDKMQATMKKLMSRNVSLQQRLHTIEAQLEHQIKGNSEIKKMLVDSTLGGSKVPVLEQYNDALIEIGALRSEVEHWRARHDELEAVVEGVVLEKSSLKEASSTDSLAIKQSELEGIES
ncbi:hypothetical protein BCR33DRAFT_848559 [Rhizoclosmatium globosum]|uniref:Uncharacterized protein n=1 Tax=Rhizoclosmatium globosum TaxID=329046 RepID=A0A1Y2CLX3_9FUNG|nr:hypothetical protein BCR33DRAFT_848559 [Rhizoclosmatium globosum]|eukprot:ORY47874.1 hypothetical protein BCR33DRAFT_848559 [Rhizoclosmatium globosum]